MSDRLGSVVARARDLVAELIPFVVEKGIWGSPMGKTHLAQRIAAELPEHRVYVEPFAGGAQVLFAKDLSEVEVVSDLDPEIAFAFKFAKGLTAEQLDRLRRKTWVGDKAHFKKLVDADVPGDDVERFYRFAYLTRFGFNKLRRGTMPDKNVGVEARFVDKLEQWAPRLKAIRVRSADYEKVIDEFDGKDAFFFLDPPYAGYDADTRVGAGHKNWDEERFGQVLRGIKGQFLCTYGLRGASNLFDGFVVRRWRHTSGVGTSQGQGIRPGVTLVVTNYDPEKLTRFHPVAGSGDALEKTLWGSPAGKKRIAARLVALLPAHKTYVEPFAGSAAVLFAKEPCEVEVLNDADPEIAEAYRAIKRLKPADLDRLRKLPWTGDEATFKRLFDARPKGELEKLHRYLYVTHFSYGKLRGRSFSPAAAGIEAATVDRLEKHGPRLKSVRIHSGDYERVVRKYDSASTVFYLDPPYPGYNVDVGESDFDEARFLAVLKSIKGKFLVTYGVRGELPARFEDEGFYVKRIRPSRTIGSMRGVGGPKVLTTLLVSNYELVEKSIAGALGDEWELDDLDKRQPFGTFGGSFHYAKRIVPMLPEHDVYVEPFAGAAAVLHAKEASAKEVLADVDDDVVFLHRSIQAMTPETVDKLRRFEWTCTKASFDRARDLVPRSDLERFYKLVFVRTHARDCRPDGTHPAKNHLGSTTDPEKFLSAAARLKDVTVLKQDYQKTIARFDGPETFFFLDPPYPGEWYDKDAVIDVEEFVDALAEIRGRFIAVLNDSPENAAAFKRVGQVFRLKVREASGTGGAKTASRLFCSNFKVAKSAEVDVVSDLDEVEKVTKKATLDAAVFAKSIPLIKGTDPGDERFVLGIVLEPEVVDAQGDIYSTDEVRQAAHRFMEEFGGLGLMHRMRVNGQVKVLESYLAPGDFAVGDATVRKGTWLLAVRILSDELWSEVKDGQLTGFSIGGSARRVPEADAPPQREAA